MKINVIKGVMIIQYRVNLPIKKFIFKEGYESNYSS